MLKPILTFTFLLIFGFSLYCQPTITGKPRMVAQTDEPFERPAWSNDGEKLTFFSLKDGALWEVSGNGRNLKKLSGSASMRRSAANDNYVLQQMISYPVNVASSIEGFKPISGYTVFNPVLSPNGEHIVFQVSQGKGLYICDADGSNLRKLSETGERATWMPDGKYVVVMLASDDGHIITNGELVVIDVATGSQTVLLSSADYITLSPAVSPDGKQLAFTEYATGAIYVVDIK